MSTRRIRCAIYTRKSTEEGLDQAFNSLDAQREACAAYILSQAGEGWTAVPDHYDDGGYSGGSMERPGLQRLLDDIGKGLVDVVVVYKIDRLTRSLADFARIVERFDARGASFVSVTQAFNTTTSMGRLTLNVLLSFAQFEREVGAERVRDKIAASRKKGMWMGGCPPLGYDVRSRKLEINEAEAETIRFIFRTYVKLRSVGGVLAALEDRGIRTKAWTTIGGRVHPGGRWYTGPLRCLLRNRVYVGEAVHKGTAYPGQHLPIIDRETFETVQERLSANAVVRHEARTIAGHSMLAGIIRDDKDNLMSPQRTKWNGDVRGRYYVSQAILQHRKDDAGSLPRLSAGPLEEILLSQMALIAHLAGAKSVWDAPTRDSIEQRVILRRWVKRIEVSDKGATFTLDLAALAADGTLKPEALLERLGGAYHSPALLESVDQSTVRLFLPGRLKMRSGSYRRELWDKGGWRATKLHPDSNLIGALARAHRWRRQLEAGEITTVDQLAASEGMERRHAQRTLRLAFLAPDLQQMIITGRQPPTIHLTGLLAMDLPLLWTEQRLALTRSA